MSLSEVDRQLLQRCLDRQPRAWQDFVDRFLGLVVHVVNRTSSGQGHRLDESTRDDLIAEVFLVFVRNDFAVLRRFRRHCSLATYLTVIARRVSVRQLRQWDRESSPLMNAAANGSKYAAEQIADAHATEERIDNALQVQQLMLRLDPHEASVVRMFHLEGKSYREISEAVGMNENSVGPVLHRARGKMALPSD